MENLGEDRDDLGTNLEIVNVFDGKKIKVLPEEEKKSFLTEELNGCTAVLIFTEEEDGKRTLCLTHYPPFMLERNKNKITELLDGNMIKATKKKVVILAENKRQEHLPDLKLHISNSLGEDTNIEVVTYTKDPSKENYGRFSAKVAPKESGTVSYSTWFSTNTL